VSLALVHPLPGVFKPFINRVLVVTTPTEVALVALHFDVSDLHVEVYSTQFSASTDNVRMLLIKGTWERVQKYLSPTHTKQWLGHMLL
jgi:hypothetical protein